MILRINCYNFIPISIYGTVAQSVEQGTENPCVGSSILPRATMKIENWELRIEAVQVLKLLRKLQLYFVKIAMFF